MGVAKTSNLLFFFEEEYSYIVFLNKEFARKIKFSCRTNCASFKEKWKGSGRGQILKLDVYSFLAAIILISPLEI